MGQLRHGKIRLYIALRFGRTREEGRLVDSGKIRWDSAQLIGPISGH